MQKSLIAKASTFFIIGIVGAFSDYGTRALLLDLGVLAALARAGSYIVGSTVAYYLNSFFTFAGDRSLVEKARAASVYCCCFGLAVAVDALLRHGFPETQHILFWSWFFSQACATIVNFLLQNYWVFAHRRP
ncbi:GtrA family protein [Corynebacterium pseudopelargi]|uniref:GtrA-like protein n=1 Tax=Corynebacterium pseudopelargi TaxID=2080757 RepID=A0A3G6IWF7_9CORY|nr:GtrA family protein [Corynebacterium pseudopelargi]AZA08294.1 GtrA-like protein [Corynebacterium pseudopelargi]